MEDTAVQLDDLFTYDSVALTPGGDGVVIVDQTLLPWEEKFLTLRDESQVYEAIAKLRVRGGAGYRDSGGLRAIRIIQAGGCGARV